MSTSAEPNPGQSELSSQSSQAMPATNELTIDKVRSWKTIHLLDWIQQNLTNPLDDEDKEAFFKSKINGSVFLKGADNEDFFLNADLSFGASVGLAELAGKLVKSKYRPLHHTLHATAS
jgi:hypothetical protein